MSDTENTQVAEATEVSAADVPEAAPKAPKVAKPQTDDAATADKPAEKKSGSRASVAELETPFLAIVSEKDDTRVNFDGSKHVMHPDVVALGIPPQTSAEYRALRDSIANNGRILNKVKKAKDPFDPTKIYIVDGWHRQHIGDELKIAVPEEIVPYESGMAIAMAESTRRNLSKNQILAISGRMLEVEKEKAEARKKANLAQNKRAAKADKPKIIEVEFEKLAENGEIFESYSADSIMTKTISAESKIKKPFEYKGALYIAVDASRGVKAECYKLVAPSNFVGIPVTYGARTQQWQDGQEKLGYDGIVVKHNKDTYVMQGPPVVFAVGGFEEPVEASEDGEKGRASAKVAKTVGLSASTIERMAEISKKDPAAAKRIELGENIPGTDRKETVGSAWTRITKNKKENSGDGEAKPEKPGERNPDEIPPTEFIEGIPLVIKRPELLQNPVFRESVRTWHWMRIGLKNLTAVAKKTKVGSSGQKDPVTKRVLLATGITHPDTWVECGKCDATGKVDSGNEGKDGKLVCPTCGGAGFALR